MINEGEYDPMEDGKYGSIMHNFVGSATVYQWLLDQEKFFIDFYQRHAIRGTVASSLLISSGTDASKCLEAVLRRGSDVNDYGGWKSDNPVSLAHVAVCPFSDFADNVDFPKRIKVLLDAGLDFVPRKTDSALGTALEWLLPISLLKKSEGNPDWKIENNKYREEPKYIPKPATRSTRRVVYYDTLDPNLNLKYRPRISKALWQTWNTEGTPTWDVVSGLSLVELAQRYFDAWMEVLLEAGLDIAGYGRREDLLHPEGVFHQSFFGEARVVFEYGSHVNGCRIHVTEIWLYDPDDDEETDEEEGSGDEEETTPAETSKMPCSWDSDDE